MSAPDGLVEVRLLGLPVLLRERSTQHGEELVREMTLLASRAGESGDSGDSGEEHIPRRLVRLAAEVRSTYGAFTAQPTAQIDDAAEAGLHVIDEIVYRVPIDVGPFCEHILQVIAEADDYCRAGRYLLTLATPADVADYQRWILGEFISQCAGGQPTSWDSFRTRQSP